MASQPTICISLFDTESQQQYFEHHPGILGHERETGKEPGSIVLLYNFKTKEVFGIGILGAFPNGKVWIETNPIDQALYTGNYKKFGKYEIKAKIFHIEPVSIKDINRECGLNIKTQISGRIASYNSANQNIRPWVNRVLAEILIAQNM
jgi:hypothetical protein